MSHYHHHVGNFDLSVAIHAACIDSVVKMFDFCVVSFCSDMINFFEKCHLSYHILEDGMALQSCETIDSGNKCIPTVVFLGVLSKFLHQHLHIYFFTKYSTDLFSGFASTSLLWHDIQIYLSFSSSLVSGLHLETIYCEKS